MDIHLNKQQLSLQKTLCDQSFEQAFELDYLLADYLPDIFKILKCEVTPAVSSFEVGTGRLTADIAIDIRVLYLAEQTHEICAISQKQSLQKQLDLPNVTPDCLPCISVSPDSVRCRAVNPRRLDLRGTVMLKVVLQRAQSAPYLSKSEGGALQQKLAECECVCGRHYVTQEFSITEISPLPYGKPPIDSILLYSCTPVLSQVSRSGDKAVCKGNVNVHLLYQAKAEENAPKSLETADFSVPADTILTLSDLSGELTLDAILEVLSAEFSLEEGGGINGQYALKASVMATQSEPISYVEDLYSTVCPIEMETASYPVLCLQETINQSCVCKNVIALPENIERIIDLVSSIQGASFQKEEGKPPMLAANLRLSMFAADDAQMPFCMEKTIPCELPLDLTAMPGDPVFSPQLQVLSTAFRMTEDGKLEVRSEISISGNFYRNRLIKMITGIIADEKNPYEKGGTALHLYYAKAGEQLWEIAKRFGTDFNAAIVENDLNETVLFEDRMLLIPVI